MTNVDEPEHKPAARWQRPLPYIIGSTIALIAAYGILGGPRDLLAYYLYLILLLLFLTPAYLAVRQLTRARPEPSAVWHRGFAFPALAGLAIGLPAGSISAWLTNPIRVDDSSWLFLWYLAAVFLCLPFAALLIGAILRKAATPRPWLTSFWGALVGAGLTVVATILSGYHSVPAYVCSFTAGYLVAAATVGPVLHPAARLGVFALVVALPTTALLTFERPSSEDLDRRRFEAVSVELVTADVPGFDISSATILQDRLLISLHAEERLSGRDFIHIEVARTPRDFNPPTHCLNASCVEIGANRWRLTTPSANTVLVRYGNSLVTLSGPEELPAEILAQAAASIRPITAQELARV